MGLTAIPQGIAYAVVAGLPPQYGLYSGFMGKLAQLLLRNLSETNDPIIELETFTGCFVYAIFGTCKDITIGPTAIMSLMIHTAVVHLNADFAILGTFLSGLVIFFLGVLNLGKIGSDA